MSVTGLCSVCNQREAYEACDQCGAIVCDKHYDFETGLCTSCKNGRRV